MNTTPKETFAFIDELLIPVCIVEDGEKVYQNTRWKELLKPELEEKILNYKASMNVEVNGNNYISFTIPVTSEKFLVWLFPADFLDKIQQDVEDLEKELAFKDKRFALMTQNAPIAFLIVERETGNILFYNNNLIMEMCEIDIPFFYSHLNIYQLIGNSSNLKDILVSIAPEQTISHQEVEVTLLNEKTRWWSINASRVSFNQADTLILAILDITAQKEKEKQLEEFNREIQAKNEELHLAQEELKAVNERLEETNKTLENSMKYARKVQKSILFPMGKIKEVFSEYDVGILFQPHTFVSGDFVWIGEKDDYVYIGVCDATGHGAGGALMAMLGNFVLNEAFKKLNSPKKLGKMLEEAHQLLIQQLYLQEVKMNADGFDAALLAFPRKISPENNKIYYAGAKSPIYLVQNKQLFTHKPDTRPIGFIWNYETRQTFPTNEFEMQEDSVIYLFTDGLTDQHGIVNSENEKEAGETKLGKKRLGQIIEKIYDKTATQQIQIMEKVIEQWQQNLPQTDDITFVVIKNK